MGVRDRNRDHRIETTASPSGATTMVTFSLSRGTEALPKPTKGERKRMSVAEFVEARFAAFDRDFGLTAIDATIDATIARIEERNGIDNSTESRSKKQNTALKSHNDDSESDEDDDACVTLTYFALLTSLYLPLLLFLWIRRSVFGAGSLIRSLFLGHILRLILAFLLLPPSTTKTLVPTWVWNAGASVALKAETFWADKRVQGMVPGWLHICLGVLLGTNEGGSHGSLGGSNNYDFPPALIALIFFTVLVFVVHPDGLTWIMLGRLRDGVRSTVQKTNHVIIMLKDGSIILTPYEISGTIAGIFIVYTIIRNIIFPKKRKECSLPTPQKEKTTRYKNKKGKKARGRNHHGSSGGRGRIRGGHYRAAKQSHETSDVTTSRSLSPPNRQRFDSDMEATTVSATSEINVRSFDRRKKEPLNKLKAETIRSSSPLDSRVGDENSCASSLATHHSNTASTQEGGKQNYRKGRGKKARKKVSNDSFFSHQSGRTRKKQVGFEGTAQTGKNNPNLPPDSEDFSGDINQIHQTSHPDNRSKKKSPSQLPDGKASNKSSRVHFNNEGYSSSSFFSSQVSPRSSLDQSFDCTEDQRIQAVAVSPPLRRNENTQRGSILERNVGVSLTHDSIQLQGANSTPQFEVDRSDERQTTSNLYEVTGNHYQQTIYQEAKDRQDEKLRYQYEASSNGRETASLPYAVAPIQYEATSNQYEATLSAQTTPIANYNLCDQRNVDSYFNNQGQNQCFPREQTTPKQHNLMSWNTGITPPPGLVPNQDSAATASEALSHRIPWRKPYEHQMTHSSYSPPPSSPRPILTSSRILDLPQCNVDNRFVNTTATSRDVPYEPFEHRIPAMPSIPDSTTLSNYNNEQNLFTNVLNSDEKIEADLQELGGQMAGSILDF